MPLSSGGVGLITKNQNVPKTKLWKRNARQLVSAMEGGLLMNCNDICRTFDLNERVISGINWECCDE